MRPVNIHTGGTCRGNPGPGRSAASIQSQSGDHFLSGGKPRTTNGRMEFMALTGGVRAVSNAPKPHGWQGYPGHRPFRPQYAVDAFNEKRVSG